MSVTGLMKNMQTLSMTTGWRQCGTFLYCEKKKKMNPAENCVF